MTRSWGCSPPAPPANRLLLPRFARQVVELPENAPKILSNDTISLHNEADVWTQRSITRCLSVHSLLTRYYGQLVYGCTNPECRTPTCLSCQRRTAKGPFRKLTSLSARDLAYYLASQDNPEKGLCPHSPVVVPFMRPTKDNPRRGQENIAACINEGDGMEHGNSGDDDGNNIASADNTSETFAGPLIPEKKPCGLESCIAKDQDGSLPEEIPLRIGDGVSGISSRSRESSSGNLAKSWQNELRETGASESNHEHTKEAGQKTKDSKSFVQNLFDTMSLRWLLSPNPVEFLRGSSHKYSTTIGVDAYQPPPLISKEDVDSISPTIPDRVACQSRVLQPMSLDFTSQGSSEAYKISAQSLSHLTIENAVALAEMTRKGDPLFGRDGHTLHVATCTESECSLYCGAFACQNVSRSERIDAFKVQTLSYTLGNASCLLQSFVEPSDSQASDTGKVLRTIGFEDLVRIFRVLIGIDYGPKTILPALWRVLHVFHRADPRLLNARSLTSGLGNNVSFDTDSNEKDPLADADAAHIAEIVICALTALVPQTSQRTLQAAHKTLALGHITGELDPPKGNENDIGSFLEVVDAFDDEMALALVKRFVNAISARSCMVEVSRNFNYLDHHGSKPSHGNSNIMDLVVKYLSRNVRSDSWASDFSGGSTQAKKYAPEWYGSLSAIFVEWLRTVILREWDGRGELRKWGVVDGAANILHTLYEHRTELGLTPEIFQTPFISEHLDPIDEPLKWLNLQTNGAVVHIFAYPFLFPPSALTAYFRALNHTAMDKAYEDCKSTLQMLLFMRTHVQADLGVLSRKLRVGTARFLVLEIRRESILTDALSQLWRRERRELMMPLRVRMGMDEGEQGVDAGGVQQEFFRMAIAEALNPDYGLFVTDESTRTSWFHTGTLEPVYKFELLGLLTSLAIYNGLTIPVNFPLAFYRKILGLPVDRLEHIFDGWSELAKGLTQLLNWTDGKVEEVFTRSYVFSTEMPGGSKLYLDMKSREDEYHSLGQHNESPAPPIGLSKTQTEACFSTFYSGGDWNRTDSLSGDPGLVTNDNREQFVQDYIIWLTDKSIRPQYEAFERGFYVCLDRKALSLFTPELLRSVVEGLQVIDPDVLERTTKYVDGFHAEHRVIKDFWHVVRESPPDKIRRLLEFVTASDRVPVGGVESIRFVIQRNGVSDDHLPTSSTCFGRLLLPEYSSRSKLREKLNLALENSTGFGTA